MELKIDPIKPNERIKFLSKKLSIPELQLIYELGYEIKFNRANHFEIKDMANKARDLYNNEFAKQRSLFMEKYFTLWFVFSAYYHMYSFRGTMIYSGVSDLTDGYINAFSVGCIAEELQQLAYHGMIDLSENFEYALQVQDIIFNCNNGGPNIKRSIDKLYKHVKTLNQAIIAYKQISVQNNATIEKKFYQLVKERTIEEMKNATELSQCVNIYHQKRSLNIYDETDDEMLKIWNETAKLKLDKATTLDQLKDVYENSYGKCESKHIALKKICQILESGE